MKFEFNGVDKMAISGIIFKMLEMARNKDKVTTVNDLINDTPPFMPNDSAVQDFITWAEDFKVRIWKAVDAQTKEELDAESGDRK